MSHSNQAFVQEAGACGGNGLREGDVEDVLCAGHQGPRHEDQGARVLSGAGPLGVMGPGRELRAGVDGAGGGGCPGRVVEVSDALAGVGGAGFEKANVALEGDVGSVLTGRKPAEKSRTYFSADNLTWPAGS